MERFRVDSINQMALKQIAAVQLTNADGPFILGRPDPALQGLAADVHPLTKYLLRLMHDEALEVEQQNHLAALAVQVVHFGDIDAILNHIYAAILAEGRPQHVVTLKLNKVVRDVLHLAHAHQDEFQKVFANADNAGGSGAADGSGSGHPAPPPKPNPEKQQVIMVQEDSLQVPSGQWSRVRGAPAPASQQQQQQSYRPMQSGQSAPTASSERQVPMDRPSISPGMLTLLVDLLVIPISIATGAHVGMTSTSEAGWQTFFLVLLPSLVVVTFVGAIAHWVWKYMQDDHS